MKFNKESLEKFVADTGEVAKKTLGKAKEAAIKAMDQNGDGKIDALDTDKVKASFNRAVEKGKSALKEAIENKEYNKLLPLFEDELNANDFVLPKVVRLLDRTKDYIESEICEGSIGSDYTERDVRIVDIFMDSQEKFGLQFYPDSTYEVYYVDPSDRDVYIALEEYFGHLKVARINELQRIAQDLGAKHFKVTFKEEMGSSNESRKKAGAKATKAASAEMTQEVSDKRYAAVEIAAEMEFPGHEPVEPELQYLRNDNSIKTLIEMRMNPDTPLLHQKFSIKMSNSSGIREVDAAKIDSALKVLKVGGHYNVAEQAKKESKSYLEYEIDF